MSHASLVSLRTALPVFPLPTFAGVPPMLFFRSAPSSPASPAFWEIVSPGFKNQSKHMLGVQVANSQHDP